MNRKGNFVGLFIFIISVLFIILISGIFIYIGNITEEKLHATLDDKTFGGNTNTSGTIEKTFGNFVDAVDTLKWVSFMMIVGMILSIFISSYMVTTKPIFLIGYIFFAIILIFVAVPVANTYETILSDTTLGSTYQEFVASNWIILNLPTVLVIISFVGAIIMFSRMGKGDQFAVG